MPQAESGPVWTSGFHSVLQLEINQYCHQSGASLVKGEVTESLHNSKIYSKCVPYWLPVNSIIWAHDEKQNLIQI